MTRRTWIPVVMLMALVGGLAHGQEAGGGRNRDGGDGQRRDPAEMRQRMEQRMRETMGATDEEWKVLQPKIEKVQTLQRQAMSSRFGGFGGFGGRRGGPGGDNAANTPANPLADAMRELRALLENKESSAEAIKQRLQAYHDAKKKAGEELTAAQNELKELLSVRQEAALVTMGVLE